MDDTEEWIDDATPQHEWSIQSGGVHQPTHYGGVVTCMVRVPELPSAGSHVDGSQLEDKWEGKGRAGKSGYFPLPHGLISTSTLSSRVLHLRKHPVPSASALLFLVYSRPRCKPIRSLTEIPNLCKYPMPVIAEVRSTTGKERNARCFFSGTENRNALSYITALKGQEMIAAVSVSLYEPFFSITIHRWQTASGIICF